MKINNCILRNIIRKNEDLILLIPKATYLIRLFFIYMFIWSNNYTSLSLLLYIYIKSINASSFFFTHLSLSEISNSTNRISIIISHDIFKQRESIYYIVGPFLHLPLNAYTMFTEQERERESKSLQRSWKARSCCHRM
jgi:hypothetical protein